VIDTLMEQLGHRGIGSDTRYGLGCLRRISWIEGQQNVFDSSVDLMQSTPTIETDRLLAHTNLMKNSCCGQQEMLVGWDYGRGISISPEPLWAPGSKAQSPCQFEVESKGIWKVAESALEPIRKTVTSSPVACDRLACCRVIRIGSYNA
jgi:hypothetical protein